MFKSNAHQFRVGDKVEVQDPTWHYHGLTGLVVKVNRKTIKVQTDPERASNFPPTIVVGAPQYFKAL